MRAKRQLLIIKDVYMKIMKADESGAAEVKRSKDELAVSR